MKTGLKILQFICIVGTLFFGLYLLIALSSSHNIPFQTYLGIGISILLSIVFYFLIGFIKRRKGF